MGDVREQLQNLTQNFCLICEDLKNVDKQKINIALDELNALNFKNFVISDSNIVLALLKTICGVIPTSESFLVSKSCKLLCRLLKNYQLPPLRCVATCKYLMKALEDCNKSVWEDILAALYVILKTNGAYVSELYDSLLGDYGVLFNLLQSNESKGAQVLNIENPFYVELGALKCIQALILHCTNSTPTSGKYLTLQHLNKCTEVAIFYLYRIKYKKQDEIIFCEILICAFNILMQIFSSNTEVDRCLGETIGACRCWMMYALKDCSSLTVAPHKVMPSQLDVSEMPQTQANKGGKKIKLRKPRNSKPVSNWKDESSKDNTHLDESVDMENNPGVYKSANAMITQLENIATPQFTIMSESDMSDWESNKHKKLLSVQIKTRLAALNLLTILVRSSEKHIIFGYWWCLLPSDDIAKSCGLTLFLQHETNTGGKTAALTAMLNIITACRSYLSIAEISKRSVTSFTPLSVSLGQTLIELHHLLSKIISNERRVPVLIAALKSMVACIQATPYHKLETTILIPMVESAKKVLSGDWTVQVAALIVMGCVISLEPPAVDIMNVFLKNPEPFDVTKSTSPGNNDSSKETYLEEDSDEYIEDILEEDAASQNLEQNVILYSHDEILEVSQETLDKMSWLVEICLRNLGWTFKNGVMEQSRLSLATVRQESLQVLSAIALKSFELLLAPHFMIISRMFHTALRDPLPDMLLHATKCLNSVGDALQKLGESSVLKQEDCVMFWTMMLRGPLTELLQSDKVAPARATACDCIGSIGENIYNKLPQQLKILCATLLLGSSGDEDALVRSAAVRALSVCIMYKDWREDPCIVSDCGESVLRVLCDATLAVKIKATWALANITDALLLNLEDKSVEQVDNYLLMRLLQESITTSKDNDKVCVL